MAPRYMKPGQDFDFGEAFGFTGSRQGRHDSQNHPADSYDDDYGDGSYVQRKKGGGVRRKAQGGAAEGMDAEHEWLDESDQRVREGYAQGGVIPGGGAATMGAMPSGAPGGAGMLPNATITMPMQDAARVAAHAMQIGHALGQRQGAAPRVGGMPHVAQPPATAAPPAMAKGGGFIKGAIKHPGRMQNAAKRAGESTHQYMEEHKHDPGSLGSAARLGLRLTGGDLRPGKKK